MSSLINQTTGECISGTCQSLELFASIPWWVWLGIIIIGAGCVMIAVLFFGRRE